MRFLYKPSKKPRKSGAQYLRPSTKRSLIPLIHSTGGVFDSPVPPVKTGPDPVGTMVIKWTSCNSAVLTYDLPTFGVMGEIPIERIVGTYVPLCEQAQP